MASLGVDIHVISGEDGLSTSWSTRSMRDQNSAEKSTSGGNPFVVDGVMDSFAYVRRGVL